MLVPPVLLKSDELFGEDCSSAIYDKAREISKYLLMHYGEPEDAFDRTPHPLAMAHGYPQRLSRLLESCAADTRTTVRRALDAGCNVGGLSHALSTWVTDLVVGVDISPRTIEVARALTRQGGGTFSIAELGPFTRQVMFRVPPGGAMARVEFELDDAGDLRPHDTPFDAIVLSNVLDRVEDPAACLRQFSVSAELLRPGGLLMIACPWSWYPEFSHPGTWLGSARDNTTSEHTLKRMLSSEFDLLVEVDEPGVLRQNPREYDYFEAHVTVWKKR